MKYFAAFLAAFAFCLPMSCDPGVTPAVFGQEIVVPGPNFEVVGQDEAEIGELVRFVVQGDVETISWRIIPGTQDFDHAQDGRRAFFSARTGGDYVFIVAAAKGGEVYLDVKTLTVKGEPAPISGLKAKVGQWLTGVRVEDPKVKLRAMAGVFRKLGEGDIDVDKILEATALANSAVLGDSLKAWIPFLDKLGTELDQLAADGELETDEQYRTVWIDLAKALEYHGKE